MATHWSACSDSTVYACLRHAIPTSTTWAARDTSRPCASSAKGDKPAEIPLNPRTHQAIDQALDGRSDGPLLLNRWGNRMQRHNAAAIVTRLARHVRITRRVRIPIEYREYLRSVALES